MLWQDATSLGPGRKCGLQHDLNAGAEETRFGAQGLQFLKKMAGFQGLVSYSKSFLSEAWTVILIDQELI